MLIHWWLQYWWAACLCSNWLKYLKVVRIWILICIKGAQMRHFYIYWTSRLAIWCNRSFSNVVHRQWYSKKKKKKDDLALHHVLTECNVSEHHQQNQLDFIVSYRLPLMCRLHHGYWGHLSNTWKWPVLSILVFRSIFSWNCTKINIISRSHINSYQEI